MDGWSGSNRLALVAGWLLVACVAGCGAGRKPGDWVGVREVTPTFLAALGARDAALAADSHGRVALTFVTRDSSGGKDLWLSVSQDSGTTFEAPQRVNPRPGSVNSFPEGRPQAVFGAAGRLAVAWVERREGDAHAADIAVRGSGDGGRTLSPMAIVNDDLEDPKQAFHGFPALAFLPDGSLFAAWMDERELPATGEEPTRAAIFYAVSPDGGQNWSDNRMLTDAMCPCCRPVALSDSAGRVAIAYRSAMDDVRDPAIAVLLRGGEQFALDAMISEDGWKLAGCPAVGSALTWNGPAGGHYAWYTGADPPGVYVAPWRPESGLAGVKRGLNDSLSGASHPRLAALGETTLIGVEGRPLDDSTRTVLAVRALRSDGSLTPWCFLGADATDGAIAGLDPGHAVACWAEHEATGPRTRVARLTLRAGR